MIKDEILALFNTESYSDIKNLVIQNDIKENENLLRILSEIEAVTSDMSYYNGLVSRYGDDNTKNAMCDFKRTKLCELRMEIEKRFCD